LFLGPPSADAQAPNLINYQGRLLNGTNLINGNVAISLRIFDEASSGTLLYEDSNSVTVADGLYSTFIGDNTTFGTLTNALANTNAHLEVMVSGAALAPRERLASVAYALRSERALISATVDDGAITGTKIADGTVSNIDLAAGSVNGATVADGSLNGTDLADGTISNADIAANTFWSTGGNTNIADGQFLGTLNGTSLEFRVSNTRVARFEPSTNAAGILVPNVIFGSSANTASNGTAFGSVIGGGGNAGSPQIVGGAYDTVAGGVGNKATGNDSTVAGGRNNEASGRQSFVGGGGTNVASAPQSVVGGGQANTASGDLSVVAGGSGNQATGDSTFIGGGDINGAYGSRSVVVGGLNNGATGAFSTVAGGQVNGALGNNSAVGGGNANTASGDYATIAGGESNTAAGAASFAAGRRAKALHGGAFTWADLTDADFSSTTNNQFLIRASGGVGIGTNVTPQMLTVAGNAIVTGSVTAASFTGNGAGVTNVTVPDNSITSAKIVNDAVTILDLQTSTVDAAYVNEGQANSILSGMIVDGSVDVADLNTNNIGNLYVNENQANSILSGMIVDGSVDVADLNTNNIGNLYVNENQANSILSGMIVDGSVDVADLNTNNIGNLYVNEGQANSILSGMIVDGSVDVADLNTNNIGNLYVNENQANSINNSMIVDGMIANAEMAANSIASSNIQNGAILFADVNQNGAASGEVIKWNGAAWTNASDNTGNPAWELGGNAGTTNGTHFVGTTDGQPLDLRARNHRGLRIDVRPYLGDTNNMLVNVIGGSESNAVSTNSYGSFIGGGGASDTDYGGNIITDGLYAVIGGGLGNRVIGDGVIVGGNFNVAGMGSVFIGGGVNNEAYSYYGTIPGGYLNIVRSDSIYSTIGGGSENEVGTNSYYTTIAGGANNTVGEASPMSSVAGGYGNDVGTNAAASTVGGGENNDVGSSSPKATIGGGQNNTVSSGSPSTTIAGGENNTVAAGATFAVVGGGYNNNAGGIASTVPGGQNNDAANTLTFAAGNRAKAAHVGSFVWADSTDADFATSADQQFLVRASGGIYQGLQDTNLWRVTGLKVVTNANTTLFTPIHVGAQLLDVGSNRIYYALGLTTNDWKGAALN